VWLPGRGRSLVAAARLRPDLDIVTTDAFVVRGSDREPTTYYEQRGWPDGDQVDAILLSSFVFGAAAIRRTAYERVGGYDEQVRFAEDWDLWIRLLVTGSRAGLVDAPLYEYRRRTDSLTGRRVDLAKGVVAMLGRVPVGALTEDQRKTLRRTRAQWRLRAARDAATARDPRRWRLAASAAAERNARARDRISVLRSLLRG
jgi:hypothetical protein